MHATVVVGAPVDPPCAPRRTRTTAARAARAGGHARRARRARLPPRRPRRPLVASPSCRSRKAFFSGESGAVYKLAGLRFSLDDIEHGILRCNTPPPGADAPPFSAADDARAPLALQQLDPRVHFALNCGARSCPPIKVFSAGRIDEELGLAARTPAWIATPRPQTRSRTPSQIAGALAEGARPLLGHAQPIER
eukprot:6381421-Prymnesium_polylepis.1